jgi:hypothetical protein
MLKPWIAGALGALNIGNGAVMLINGRYWYDAAPGVPDTGPFNPHFVADIGAAFVVAGLALVVRAWRSHYWPAALVGAGFLSAHGLIHLAGLLGGHAHHLGVELGVILPSALALWAALPSKGESHA